MPTTYHTLAEAARSIGVDKATASRHAACEPKLGLRAGQAVLLTDTDVRRLVKRIEAAKNGNPQRAANGRFAPK